MTHMTYGLLFLCKSFFIDYINSFFPPHIAFLINVNAPILSLYTTQQGRNFWPVLCYYNLIKMRHFCSAFLVVTKATLNLHWERSCMHTFCLLRIQTGQFDLQLFKLASKSAFLSSSQPLSILSLCICCPYIYS